MAKTDSEEAIAEQDHIAKDGHKNSTLILQLLMALFLMIHSRSEAAREPKGDLIESPTLS